MNAGSTFERVYHAIKSDLLRGAYRPGDILEPKLIGSQLFASVTPVRDALHRLAGERLIEAAPHNGFRSPLLTENGLRDLYRWQELLALTAIRLAPVAGPSGAMERPPAAEPAQRTRWLFAVIAALSHSTELQIANLQTTDRLESARHLEPRILVDCDQELAVLEQMLIAGDFSGLRRALARYRARRQRLVPHLLTAMLNPAS